MIKKIDDIRKELEIYPYTVVVWMIKKIDDIAFQFKWLIVNSLAK